MISLKSGTVLRVGVTRKCWLNRKQQQQRHRAAPSAFCGGLTTPAAKWMPGCCSCPIPSVPIYKHTFKHPWQVWVVSHCTQI